LNTPLYIPVLEERKKYEDYRYGIWGDSFSWYQPRDWKTIEHLVIHHSVTTPTSNSKNDVDYIAELHRRRGWGGVGYHLIITADGVVWYVGDIGVQRANVADMNHKVIGICLVGDFTNHNPTDEQILSAHDLCKHFLFNFPPLVNTAAWEDVVGHKELQATACPGISWKGAPDSMYERIKNRIPYTPQPAPVPEIDWKKKFEQLEALLRIDREEWEDEKKLLVQAEKVVGVKLALCSSDCEEEKERLNGIIENLNSENPVIPPPDIKDFSNKEVFARVIQIITDKFKKLRG